MSRPALVGDLVVVPMALFGALWTVTCHAVVASGGSFHALQRAAVVPLLLWVALATGIAWRARDDLRAAVHRLASPGFLRSERWTVLATLLAVAIVLFLCRWDQDQTFYVSIPVFTLDHPDLPLLAQDTMLGEPGVPLLSDPYRLHTFELLAAVLSSVSGLHPVHFLHFFFPLLYLPACLIAWSRFVGYFHPERRQIGLLLIIAFCLFFAERNELPGNMALIRFDDGKNIVYFVIVPLLFHYGRVLLDEPRAATFGAVFLLCTFAVGLSSSALFVVPLQLGWMSVLSLLPAPRDRRRQRAAVMTLLAASYPIACALIIRRTMRVPYAVLGDWTTAHFDYWRDYYGHTGLLLIPSLLLVGWLFAPGERRRFLVLWPLPILALMFVPPLAKLTARHLTSPVLFSRITWVLPLLGYVALLFTRLHERLRGVARVVVLGALALAIVPFNLFLPENRLEFRLAWARADRRLYEAARFVADHQPPGTAALGPEELVMYLPWMSHHPRLVCDRGTHLWQANLPFGEEESKARERLQQMVSSTTLEAEFDAAFFRAWVERLRVGSVSVREPEARPALLAALRSLGFAPAWSVDHPRYSTCEWCHLAGSTGDIRYEVWLPARRDIGVEPLRLYHPRQE